MRDMLEKQIVSCLRLFKGYLPNCTDELDVCKTVLEFKEDMLKRGLLFVTKTTEDIPPKVVELAVNMYGVKEEEWNQTFHKSFATVRDTDIETLVVQQIVHYITTYGFEALGIYDKDTVYIPKEELEIPELDRDIPLVVIKELSEEELGEKLLTLLTSGIALSEQTVQDVMNLSDYIPKTKFDDIKNKELRTALYDKYDIVPRNNVEFLRYMIYKLTGSTLLIKNQQTIKSLKEADKEQVYNLLHSYLTNTPNGYIKLAEIFLRYKDLFLALKRPLPDMYEYSDKEKQVNLYINHSINKISKLTSKHHKPLQPQILDCLTNIKDEYEFDLFKDKILNELDNVTIFRELRILNGLRYRLQNPENMLYKIRNGKAYLKESKDYNVVSIKHDIQSNIYDLVYNHLVKRLSITLKDKTAYIPDNINYAIPTSEKQFNENIPEGTYIEIPKVSDMVVGVHWKNTSGRVDLDLHAQNKDEQFGWNTSYRSTSGQQFYYSGDITSPNEQYGATEVFYIGQSLQQKAFLLTLNKYCSPGNEDVPYEFFVAETDENQVDKNYVVNPNKVKFITTEKFKWLEDLNRFEANQKALAFVVISVDNIRIYFNDFTLGSSIVTGQNKVTKGVFDCLQLQAQTSLPLKQLLVDCGVKLLNSPVYDEFIQDETILDDEGQPVYKKVQYKVDYDLSLENLDKTTFLDLLQCE